MKKILIIIGFYSLVVASCNMAKKLEYKIPPIDYIPMTKFGISDSSKVEALLKKAAQEHKNLGHGKATCFKFSQREKSKSYVIVSSDIFFNSLSIESISNSFGFVYYKDNIILISKSNIPQALFYPTNEECYVASFYELEDISKCMFDSTFTFIKSENGFLDSKTKKGRKKK